MPTAMTIAAGLIAEALAAAFGLVPEQGVRAESTQTLSAGEIERRVADALRARLRETGSSVRIDRVSGLREQRLPAENLALEIGAIAGRWPRKVAAVPVSIRVDGRAVRVLEARVEASDPRVVLVYAQARAAETPVAELTLATATVDLIDRETAPLTSTESLVGLRTRRGVRAGQPVMHADFEPVPDVARRDRVEIEVRRGAVRIATVGTALADARVGETVAVLPMNADAAVIARVRAKQKVEVDARSP